MRQVLGCRIALLWKRSQTDSWWCKHVLDLVLKHCSYIKEGIGIQLLFYLVILVNCVVYKIDFSSVGQVFGLMFLVLQCHGNVCNWIPKLIWPRMDSFWSFLLEYASFRRFLICFDWNLKELLKCYSFLTISNLFDCQFEGYSGLFFKCARNF